MKRVRSDSDRLIVLLPGMDGTGALFEPLLGVIPACFSTQIVHYPPDRPLSYAQLLPLVREQVPVDRRVVLVAESFSGPLALRFAMAYSQQVRAIVLCASFIRSPVPAWVDWMLHPLMFGMPIPSIAIRAALLGWNAPAVLVRTVQKTIRDVAPAVLAMRLREVVALDCTDALVQCPVPVLMLQPDRDRIVRRFGIRELESSGARIRVRRLPGPHLLLQTAPEAAWRAIQSFVEESEDAERAESEEIVS